MRNLEKADTPGRHDKMGGTEYVHALVSTGSVGFTDAWGNDRKEELVFPPRRLVSTSASHTGVALIENMEQHLFGCPVQEALQCFAELYKSVGIHLVGDSAKSNIKVVRQLFNFLRNAGERAHVPITCNFTPCLMHQVMRIILMMMNHKAMVASLYSMTRIQATSAVRQRTFAAMKQILDDRFVFHADSVPPNCATTDPFFRDRLKEILISAWNGMVDEDAFQRRTGWVTEMLNFFNADLRDKTHLIHHCQGCHRDRAHALNHVPCLACKIALDLPEEQNI